MLCGERQVHEGRAGEPLNLKQLWTAALGELQVGLPRATYDTWFKDTQVISEEDDVFLIGVPNAFAREWLENKFRQQVRATLQHLVGRTVDVRFVTAVATPGSRPGGSVATGNGNGAHGAAHAGPVERRDQGLTAVLNARYTFANFVVGSNNRLAHAAALSVAERPGHSYNPLFVYGGSGLGKTHLMHAIGHAVTARHPKKRVAYATSEKFTNEFINSIRAQKGEDFRERYRRVDVLLVDDIQFIAGKEGTQEEFFHTFNTLFEAQKQVVLSSDCPPKEIRSLEERLRSRFGWGLMADLQTPDLETRLAILAKKAEAEHVVLDGDVAQFIASRMKSSIRELEGALIRVIAYSSLIGTEISLPLAQQVLKPVIDLEARRVSIENIQRVVCDEFKLSVSQLKAKNNSRAVAHPRQIAMYLAKELTTASLPQIGREFGGKHHTTALHAINKIREMRKSDRVLDRLIHKLTDSLN